MNYFKVTTQRNKNHGSFLHRISYKLIAKHTFTQKTIKRGFIIKNCLLKTNSLHSDELY